MCETLAQSLSAPTIYFESVRTSAEPSRSARSPLTCHCFAMTPPRNALAFRSAPQGPHGGKGARSDARGDEADNLRHDAGKRSVQRRRHFMGVGRGDRRPGLECLESFDVTVTRRNQLDDEFDDDL